MARLCCNYVWSHDEMLSYRLVINMWNSLMYEMLIHLHVGITWYLWAVVLLTPTQFCRSRRSVSPWTRSEEGDVRARWAPFWGLFLMLSIWDLVYMLSVACEVWNCIYVCVCVWSEFDWGSTPCRSSIIVCVQVKSNTPFLSRDLANFWKKKNKLISLLLF